MENTEHHGPNKRQFRSTKRVAEAREQQAWELRATGYTVRTIAAKLGMSPSSVHEALTRAAARLLPQMVDNIAAMKVQQTSILEDKIEEALLA